MSNRFYHKSLLSQNRFYHKIAFITNRFYHKIAFITNRFYHKIAIGSPGQRARPGTAVRPPRAPMTYWTTPDITLDAIGSIETKSRTVHHVQSLLSQIAFITNRFYHKSLLSQNRFYHKIAFITNRFYHKGETRDSGPTSQCMQTITGPHMMYHHWYTSAKMDSGRARCQSPAGPRRRPPRASKGNN